MKSLRKYVALTLMCILVFSSIRYLLFNQLMQFKKPEYRKNSFLSHKKDIKEIHVTASRLYQNTGNIQWADDNQELIIDNVFHEILSISKLGDSYLIKVIVDEEENKSYTHFFDLVKSNQKLADYLLLVLNFHYNLPCSFTFEPPTSTNHSFLGDLTQALLSGHLFKIIKPPSIPTFS